MNDDELEKELKEIEQIPEEYKNLPPDVYTALMSADTSLAISAITKSNKLHVDQMGKLADAVNWVLSGEIYARDFVKALKQTLNVDDTLANKISSDVNEQIFKPVQESLRKMDEAGDTPKVEEVELSREDLLREIENPRSTPLSGRRAEYGRLNMEDGIGNKNTEDTDTLNTDDMTRVIEEAAANEPATKPKSILESKLQNATTTSKKQIPVDPYRELPV